MRDYKDNYMTETETGSKFSRSKLKTGKVLSLAFVAMLLIGAGVAATSSPDVSIGSNGISINTGQLDLNTNALTGVSTIEDASGNQVASVKDNQNSVEMTGGFKLPTGTDAYN